MLEHDVDINELDHSPNASQNMWTPLHCAASSNGLPFPVNIEILRFLLDHRADPRVKNVWGPDTVRFGAAGVSAGGGKSIEGA